jgi:hypothetical protein
MACHDAAAFGIFANIANAESAIDGLTMAGFSNHALSVLLSDKDEAKVLATENTTRASEGATAGAGVGGVVGGALGLLAGIGALTLPGVGPFIAAGSHYGEFGRLGCRRGSGWLCGSVGRHGYPGVRSEAL